MDEFARSFASPDRTVPFAHGSLEVVNVPGGSVGFMTMHPGWRWSNDLRAIVGTDTCHTRHVGYCLAGQLHVELDDGATFDITAGELFVIPPGHDAWVVGDATCTILDWGAMTSAPAPAEHEGVRS